MVGIGINVGKMEFPEELKEIATSVENECGFEVERERLIAEVLKSLKKWYPSVWDSTFLSESKRRSILLGKEIRVHGRDDSFYEAVAVDLDAMGHLIIEKDGKRELLHSGEVSIRF